MEYICDFILILFNVFSFEGIFDFPLMFLFEFINFIVFMVHKSSSFYQLFLKLLGNPYIDCFFVFCVFLLFISLLIEELLVVKSDSNSDTKSQSSNSSSFNKSFTGSGRDPYDGDDESRDKDKSKSFISSDSSSDSSTDFNENLDRIRKELDKIRASSRPRPDQSLFKTFSEPSTPASPSSFDFNSSVASTSSPLPSPSPIDPIAQAKETLSEYYSFSFGPDAPK